jgi:hypothetical protein
MPQPPQLAKAVLTEIWRNPDGAEIPKPTPGPAKVFTVQFNPETLKVNYSTMRSGGTQPAGGGQQFNGQMSTRLAMELWFDITLTDPSGDVRNLTREISYFLAPQSNPSQPNQPAAPPAVRFQWGSFLFRGVLDTMDETLELFSEDGRALRGNVSISFSEQRVARDLIDTSGSSAGAGLGAGFSAGFSAGISGSAGISAGISGGISAGTTPLVSAQAGVSLPQMAANLGFGTDWKGIASANGIENPRQLSAGAQIDFSASAKGGIG